MACVVFDFSDLFKGKNGNFEIWPTVLKNDRFTNFLGAQRNKLTLCLHILTVLLRFLHMWPNVRKPTKPPKVYLSVGLFKKKKGNNSRTPEQIFLKFCDIVHECKCQLLMWSVDFSYAENTIKSSCENDGNFLNKNWYSRKYCKTFFPLIFNVLITSVLTFQFPYVISQRLSTSKCISQSLLK